MPRQSRYRRNQWLISTSWGSAGLGGGRAEQGLANCCSHGRAQRIKTAAELTKEARRRSTSEQAMRPIGGRTTPRSERFQGAGTPVVGTLAAKRAPNHERSASRAGRWDQGMAAVRVFRVAMPRPVFGMRDRTRDAGELANRGSQRQNPARGSASG